MPSPTYPATQGYPAGELGEGEPAARGTVIGSQCSNYSTASSHTRLAR
jgi:hypothetical protein